MKFGSLFAGIGGLDLGLERAGMECRWQVEIDDYATKVLEKHWPDVARYRDVREVGAHNLEPVDLICGGFPCQDVSSAGKKEGAHGAKSGLWKEFLRIVRELQPGACLLENVTGLTTREGGLGDILGALAEVGYNAEWFCLSAATLGAPHKRQRIFIYAYSKGKPACPINDEASRLQTTNTHTNSREQSFRWNFGRAWGERELAERRPTNLAGWQAPVSPFCGVGDGISSRMDRLRCLGNAVVPQVAEFIGRQILKHSQ